MGFLAGRTKVGPSLRIYLPPTAALGAPGTPLRGMRTGRQAPFASDLRRGRTANRGGLLGKVLARRSALRVAPLSEDGVDMEGTERAACERGGPGQCRLVRRPRSSAASGRGSPAKAGVGRKKFTPRGEMEGHGRGRKDDAGHRIQAQLHQWRARGAVGWSGWTWAVSNAAPSSAPVLSRVPQWSTEVRAAAPTPARRREGG